MSSIEGVSRPPATERPPEPERRDPPPPEPADSPPESRNDGRRDIAEA